MERELEELRKKLSLRNDFNLLDSFKIFDQNGRGFLTCGEFEKALISFGINSSKNDIYLFFRRYDSDCDGLLRKYFVLLIFFIFL